MSVWLKQCQRYFSLAKVKLNVPKNHPFINSHMTPELIFKTANLNRFSSVTNGKHQEEEFNEPGGYLFGRKAGEPLSMKPETWMFLIFYIGGTGLFFFIYQYKPECDPQQWAMREALKRIEMRGVNLEDYRYKLPVVYK